MMNKHLHMAVPWALGLVIGGGLAGASPAHANDMRNGVIAMAQGDNAGAERLFTRAAATHDPEAETLLALFTTYIRSSQRGGPINERDARRTVTLLEDAASHGFPVAAYYLAMIYDSGMPGVAANPELAARYQAQVDGVGLGGDNGSPSPATTTNAAPDSSAAARRLVMQLALHPGSGERQSDELREQLHLPASAIASDEAAEQGGAPTQFLRGVAQLRNGADGAPFNPAAFRLLRQSADQNYLPAQVALARELLATPNALLATRQLGTRYARLAAAQGQPDMLDMLGTSLCACHSDTTSMTRGLALLNLAIWNGSAQALWERSGYWAEASPDHIAAAQALSDRCRREGIAACGILNDPFPFEVDAQEGMPDHGSAIADATEPDSAARFAVAMQGNH